ncbi:ParB family chromosome partitioning protein [Agrobacterium vitis]|nr:ParB family chromosome partitioning protein [Agrobacterium vitis]MBE1437916.1 ParB family chromosome partitioning protein [Agrobacterium vitis]
MKKSILQRMAAAENREGAEPDASDRSQPMRRHSSPVISNVGKVLSQLSEDSIFSLDPTKIERSPFMDRFASDVDAEKELEALRLSIEAEGQKIPVLVRPHPTRADHYQLAYGYRRLAAILAIMAESGQPEKIKIKAYVRELTDRQLIEEQSLENGVRENLTWIEQAMWAVQLKAAGLSNRAICPVLGLSEAAVSHLFRVTSVVPDDVVYAIGRAKTVGRPKWTAFAELLKDRSALERVRAATKTAAFLQADGPGRIALAMRAASTLAAHDGTDDDVESHDFVLDNRLFCQMKSTPSGTRMTIPKKETAFAQWLAARLPDLMAEFDQTTA